MLIVLLLVLTPTFEKVLIPTRTLRFKSLYLILWFNVVCGFTFTNTLWPLCNKWSWSVVTVTFCLEDSIVRFSYFVLKLWLLPVPTPTNKSILAVLPIPTNSPVVPRPTFWVAIPIKSFVIFATNNCWPSDKVVAIPTFDCSL